MDSLDAVLLELRVEAGPRESEETRGLPLAAAGSLQRVVDAARVSYGKGTKAVRRNEMLIDYLLSHEHTSPFEHVVLEIHCQTADPHQDLGERVDVGRWAAAGSGEQFEALDLAPLCLAIGK